MSLWLAFILGSACVAAAELVVLNRQRRALMPNRPRRVLRRRPAAAKHSPIPPPTAPATKPTRPDLTPQFQRLAHILVSTPLVPSSVPPQLRPTAPAAVETTSANAPPPSLTPSQPIAAEGGIVY